MPFLPNVFPWLLSLLCRLFLPIKAYFYLFEFTAKELWNKCETGTMIHLSNVDLRRIGEEKIKRLSAILADYRYCAYTVIFINI